MAEDRPLKYESIAITGKLNTAVDPTQLTKGDFQELSNLRYTNAGLKSVKGMTKITTSALPSTTVQSGYHFTKNYPPDNHLLVQANNGANGYIYENTTAIPSAGNFQSTPIKDLAATTDGRFSPAPDGCCAFGNGSDLIIWGGNESRCAGLIITDTNDSTGGTPTKIWDYTDQVIDYNQDTLAYMQDRYMHIASTRRLRGVHFYVDTPNTASQLVAPYYWDGAWKSVTNLVDNTKTGGKSLSKSGTMTFDVADTAILRYFNNTLAYWYIFDMGTSMDKTTALWAVTVDAPWQEITDIWDGAPRDIASFQLYNSTTAKYEDYSSNVFAKDYVSGATQTYMSLNSTGVAANFEFIVGFTERMQGVKFEIVSSNSNNTTATTSVSYWDGDSWATVSSLRDGTSVNSCSFGQSGAITWADPGKDNEFKQSIGSPDLFYYYKFNFSVGTTTTITPVSTTRTSNQVFINAPLHGLIGTEYITVAGATPSSFNISTATVIGVIDPNNFLYNQAGIDESASVQPTITVYTNFSSNNTIFVDYIYGIPASSTLDVYQFPATFQNRLVLCNNQADESNTVLIGGANTSCVFNGSDSTKLFFGDSQPVVAAAPFFSRFSNQYFENLIVFKPNSVWVVDGTSPEDYRTFKIASIHGCAAPFTLTSCDIGYNTDGGAFSKSALIWQSHSGVVMWDGTAVIPIHLDIEDVFDQSNSYAIDLTMMSKSRAFFDEVNREWHWLWASKGNTSLNMEYVFDVLRAKWYTIDRGTGKKLQLAINVIDSNNNRYNYGVLTTSIVERLENGTDFDGNNIVSSFKTGDIPLSGWMTTTSVRKIKPLFKSKNTTVNNVSLTYYGDSKSTADTTLSFDPTDATHRVVQTVDSLGLQDYIFHSFKLSMTTNNENICFEPIGLGIYYKDIRADVR